MAYPSRGRSQGRSPPGQGKCILRCREHPEKPEPWDEKGRFHYDEYGYEHWIPGTEDDDDV